MRGIALRSEELELGPWIDALARVLIAESEHSERGRTALQQLLQ